MSTTTNHETEHQMSTTATTATDSTDPLGDWLRKDRESGRFAERMASGADALERLLPKGSVDSSGNRIETLTGAMRRAAAAAPKGNLGK